MKKKTLILAVFSFFALNVFGAASSSSAASGEDTRVASDFISLQKELDREPLTNMVKGARLLGVPDDATEAQMKKAYFKLARKWHPDRQDDKDIATKVFKILNQVYNNRHTPVDPRVAEQQRQEAEQAKRTEKILRKVQVRRRLEDLRRRSEKTKRATQRLPKEVGGYPSISLKLMYGELLSDKVTREPDFADATTKAIFRNLSAWPVELLYKTRREPGSSEFDAHLVEVSRSGGEVDLGPSNLLSSIIGVRALPATVDPSSWLYGVASAVYSKDFTPFDLANNANNKDFTEKGVVLIDLKTSKEIGTSLGSWRLEIDGGNPSAETMSAKAHAFFDQALFDRNYQLVPHFVFHNMSIWPVDLIFYKNARPYKVVVKPNQFVSLGDHIGWYLGVKAQPVLSDIFAKLYGDYTFKEIALMPYIGSPIPRATSPYLGSFIEKGGIQEPPIEAYSKIYQIDLSVDKLGQWAFDVHDIDAIPKDSGVVLEEDALPNIKALVSSSTGEAASSSSSASSRRSTAPRKEQRQRGQSSSAASSSSASSARERSSAAPQGSGRRRGQGSRASSSSSSSSSTSGKSSRSSESDVLPRSQQAKTSETASSSSAASSRGSTAPQEEQVSVSIKLPSEIASRLNQDNLQMNLNDIETYSKKTFKSLMDTAPKQRLPLGEEVQSVDFVLRVKSDSSPLRSRAYWREKYRAPKEETPGIIVLYFTLRKENNAYEASPATLSQ